MLSNKVVSVQSKKYQRLSGCRKHLNRAGVGGGRGRGWEVGGAGAKGAGTAGIRAFLSLGPESTTSTLINLEQISKIHD